MTIKVGNRVRVRDTYFRDGYHGQYFKSEEVLFSHPVGTAFGFEEKHLEVIPPETKPLTDQELVDEWRKSSLRTRDIRREMQARGFKCQSNVIAKNDEVWTNLAEITEEKWRYRFLKSVTTVEETVL